MNDQQHPEELVLQAYFDVELSSAEAATVKEHCGSCAECRQILADLKMVREMVLVDRPEEKPAPVWAAISDKTEDRQPRRNGPAFAFGTASVCAAGVILGLLVGTPASNTVTSENSITWASANSMWSTGSSSSLLDIYSTANTNGRSDES